MKSRQAMFMVISLMLAPMGARDAHAQDKLPLQRVQTIPMPTVSGRMDHLAWTLKAGVCSLPHSVIIKIP